MLIVPSLIFYIFPNLLGCYSYKDKINSVISLPQSQLSPIRYLVSVETKSTYKSFPKTLSLTK
jgi:hypothetical protein